MELNALVYRAYELTEDKSRVIEGYLVGRSSSLTEVDIRRKTTLMRHHDLLGDDYG